MSQLQEVPTPIDQAPLERSVFNRRDSYKPFWFPWAYQAFLESERMHWLASEVPLNEDVRDWRNKLSAKERNLLTQIFRFFTQADVDVARGYIERYMPAFKPVEIRMMLASFAAREGVHIQAYSTFIDEIGMPETEYSAFMEYQEMLDKHEFLFQSRPGKEGLLRDIAVFSAFGEGLQLFASFIILLNMTRFGKMKGMGQILAWSIRDETHHVDSLLGGLYKSLLAELGGMNDKLADELYNIAERMVGLEDRFIDLAFAEGESQGLTPEEVKLYIRFIADIRLQQLGLQPQFGIQENPLPWVDFIVFGKERVLYFETTATDYAKVENKDWDDAFN